MRDGSDCKGCACCNEESAGYRFLSRHACPNPALTAELGSNRCSESSKLPIFHAIGLNSSWNGSVSAFGALQSSATNKLRFYPVAEDAGGSCPVAKVDIAMKISVRLQIAAPSAISAAYPDFRPRQR
jgi:hypothetical protein